MKLTKNLTVGVILILLVLSISSCDKKEDQQTLSQQQEQFANKEKEQKDKEEFLRIKEEQLRQWEERLKQIDSTLVSSGSITGTTQQDTSKTITIPTSKDSAKIKEKTLKEKKMEEKEKELNKRLDNPKVAINDYLEYIQRGVNDSKTFDANMKKASEVWDNRSTDSFKKNYKSTKKFVITEEPKVVSQKGGTAVVKVKVKQTMVGADGKEVEKQSEISYTLQADKNGKWKIKTNVVK